MKHLINLLLVLVLLSLTSVTSAENPSCEKSKGISNATAEAARECDTEGSEENFSSSDTGQSQSVGNGQGLNANGVSAASHEHDANANSASAASHGEATDEEEGDEPSILTTELEIPREALYLRGGCGGFIPAWLASSNIRVLELFSVHGCFLRLDEDGDGVPNWIDSCPDTPEGAIVDPNGCPLPDLPELPELPDLIINLQEDFPVEDCTPPDPCNLEVHFTVSNIGFLDVSVPFEVSGETDSGGLATVTIAGAVPFGGSVDGVINFEYDSTCYDLDCEATLTVDSSGAVEEVIETNNTDTQVWQGIF